MSWHAGSPTEALSAAKIVRARRGRAGTAASTRLTVTHQSSDGHRFGIALSFERGDDAGPVGRRAVLAQLVFAFHPGDGDLQPDNALQHCLEIGLGEILHSPWGRVAGFMTLG